jgi:hypothetical protein
LKTEIFAITPPFTQLNTPYPATAYIKGFLNTKNISATQADLGIEVILQLFSKKGLQDLFSHTERSLSVDDSNPKSDNAKRIFAFARRIFKNHRCGNCVSTG